MRALADDRRPALAASVALHVGVFAAGLLALSMTKPIKLGEVVPVTLVSSDQVSNIKPAVQALNLTETQRLLLQPPGVDDRKPIP